MNVRLCPGFHRTHFTSSQTCYSGDNGADPILGPPFPPINYQAFINPNAVAPDPRVTWTVPDVVLSVAISSQTFIFVTFQCSILNFTWPGWNGGSTYIQNERASFGGVRYYSLQNNNTGFQPNTNPSFWAVDTTMFELYWFDFQGSIALNDFIKIADSNGFSLGTVAWDWTNMRFAATFGLLAEIESYTFYAAAAVPGGRTVTSQEFAVLVTP